MVFTLGINELVNAMMNALDTTAKNVMSCRISNQAPIPLKYSIHNSYLASNVVQYIS